MNWMYGSVIASILAITAIGSYMFVAYLLKWTVCAIVAASVVVCGF